MLERLSSKLAESLASDASEDSCNKWDMADR